MGNSTDQTIEIPPLGMTSDEFRTRGKEMIDFIADYYDNISSYPVRSQVSPGFLTDTLPASAPQQPVPWSDTMTTVKSQIMPGVTHWESPHFHAYFPAGSSYPSQLGDMLSNCFNMIHFNWINGPAATELEIVVMDWLVDMLQLPSFFKSTSTGGGATQCSASVASLVSLITAREHATMKFKVDVSELVGYCSDQTHASVNKAFKLAGILEENIRVLPSTGDNLSMDANLLRKMIKEDIANGLRPFFIGATLGTTSTTEYDHLDLIGPIAKEFQCWLHVDAAYAGSAFVCDEHRYMLKGSEYMDSFLFNPHKWMLVNFDCSALWVKHRKYLTSAMGSSFEIYRNDHSENGRVVDFRNWSIALGRKFRAMKLWMVIQTYGVLGIQNHIRKHCALAKSFDTLVGQDSRFEIVARTHLGLVSFRVIQQGASLERENRLNLNVINELNDKGDIFIVHSKKQETIFLRFCICSPLTESCHVEYAWKCIQEAATKVLRK